MNRIKDGFKGERSYVLPAACVDFMERHPLSKILHVTDIGYYPYAENHYRERTYPIEQYVFIYCVEGSGWFKCGNLHRNIESNQYFILPPGVPHCYASSIEKPWTIYWIHFNGELASQFFPATPFTGDLKPGVKSRIANRLDIFEEIMMILERGFDQENLLYVCSVFNHFLGTLRFLHQYRNDSEPDVEPIELSQAAIHFMNENIGCRLKLKDIADYIGYSQSRFSEVFFNNTGMSPLEYFNRLKIKYACRLLDGSRFSIQQISHKVGFDDPYYFSRLFKKIIGMSPANYRASLCTDSSTTL